MPEYLKQEEFSSNYLPGPSFFSFFFLHALLFLCVRRLERLFRFLICSRRGRRWTIEGKKKKEEEKVLPFSRRCRDRQTGGEKEAKKAVSRGPKEGVRFFSSSGD